MVFFNRRRSEYFTKGVSDWSLIVLPPKKDEFRSQYTNSGKLCFEATSLAQNPFEFFNVKCRYFCILERF